MCTNAVSDVPVVKSLKFTEGSGGLALYATVQSRTDSDTEYSVVRYTDEAKGSDGWACPCKDFFFRQQPVGGQCDHITAVRHVILDGVYRLAELIF